MKYIWAAIFVLAVAIGVGSFQETASASLPLVTGSILIVSAVLTGLSLRFSGFGRWFLGRLWPGQFLEERQKRTATVLALALLLAYLLWGIGTVLQSLDGSSLQVESIESALTVLGALGVCGALWAQRVLTVRGVEK